MWSIQDNSSTDDILGHSFLKKNWDLQQAAATNVNATSR